MKNSFVPRRGRRHAPLRAVVVSLGSALAVLPAMAQGPVQLDAIVVSGEKSEALHTPTAIGSNLGLTPLQTPASVEAVTREQIEARGDARVEDAITRAAGISAIGHPGNGLSALSARGFTEATSVMRLYDGMRQYGGVGVTFPFNTWAIERIEVLRGPASVIHGDGAIGGVVNVVPKKPTRGPIENEVMFTLGTQGTARVGVGSGGALDEQFSYRVDASANRSDGWVDRGDMRDRTFSGVLRWDATTDLALTLTHAFGDQEPMRYFGTPLIDGRPLRAIRGNNYNVRDSEIRFLDRWTQLDAEWTPNDATRVRARAYHIESDRDWRNAERYVYNPGTGQIDRSDNTEIRHDQAQSGVTADVTFEGRLGGHDNVFSIGFDTSRSKFRHTNNTYSGSSGPVDVFDPEPGYFDSPFPTIPRFQNHARQQSVFMEDRLSLNGRWSVVGGLRYDRARIKRDDLLAGKQVMTKTYSDVGWRLGTVFDLKPDLALYVQYAKAADPVRSQLFLTPANSAFDMTEGRQIEVGLKQSLMGGRGEWTLAAYEIRKTDLLTRDPINPALSMQIGEQSSRGLEASFNLPLARNWRVEGNLALLRARYEDFNESSGGASVSRKGNVPTNVPERVANLWMSWDFAPDWTAMAGARHVGKRYADNANTLKLPAYTTMDLALEWRIDAKTTVTARGFNVFDKAYFTTAYYTNTQWLYGPSRRFELTVNHRF